MSKIESAHLLIHSIRPKQRQREFPIRRQNIISDRILKACTMWWKHVRISSHFKFYVLCISKICCCFLNSRCHVLKGKILTVFSAIMQSNYPVKFHFDQSTNKDFYATRTKSQSHKPTNFHIYNYTSRECTRSSGRVYVSF